MGSTVEFYGLDSAYLCTPSNRPLRACTEPRRASARRGEAPLCIAHHVIRTSARRRSISSAFACPSADALPNASFKETCSLRVGQYRHGRGKPCTVVVAVRAKNISRGRPQRIVYFFQFFYDGAPPRALGAAVCALRLRDRLCSGPSPQPFTIVRSERGTLLDDLSPSKKVAQGKK